MADQKITQLTELTAPTTDDMLAVVDDPTGTPLSKKLSILKLLTLAVSNVTVQVLTSGSGTYTPTTAMKKALLILVGGGGGGGNVAAADDASGGGGGGGTLIQLVDAETVGTSQAYVVGAASTAGGAGNDTTMTGLGLTAGGGGAGSATGNTTTLGTQAAGGAGGTVSGGDELMIPGKPGMRALIYDGTNGCGGSGGDSVFGKGGAQSGTNAAGNNGTGYGGGGGGAHTNADVDRNGGTGAAGVIYVVEFLS